MSSYLLTYLTSQLPWAVLYWAASTASHEMYYKCSQYLATDPASVNITQADLRTMENNITARINSLHNLVAITHENTTTINYKLQAIHDNYFREPVKLLEINKNTKT